MIEVLVIVEIIQIRLGAKLITFDRNHNMEQIDFFIVQDSLEVSKEMGKKSGAILSKRNDFR
jgi:hypothetical protein